MNEIDSKFFFDFFTSCTQLYIDYTKNGLTGLQHNEKVRILKNSLLDEGNKYLNKDMTMEGYIVNIGEGGIHIRRWNTWNELIIEYPNNIENDFEWRMINFFFSYKPESFRNKLLTYNVGDYVRITGNIYYIFDGRGGIDIGIKKENDTVNKHTHKYSVYLDLIAIEKRTKPTSESSSTGCFIATVCYGDYNATEVIVLRNYRDNVLLKTNLGRIAISIYYLLSPSFARLLEKSESAKAFIRKNILAPIVSKIKLNRKSWDIFQ